ncbi:hypothetical protein LCGC14_0968620 [marine sediment metagenome]|uniref:Methyltransferase FkbM domain-containing protein n=1 Tax=marine sediment metagenome TaxID=412755 RepID=A0A0F9NYF7_9ZZZZ
MMPVSDLAKFIHTRARQDGLGVTACRLLRFALIAGFLIKPAWQVKTLQKNGLVSRSIMYNTMLLDPHDPGISKDLLTSSQREPYLTNAVRGFLCAGNTVIDIGANIGYYALQEAMLVGPKGKVYAIEPMAHNMEVLQRSIELNRYSNIETSTMAMGDTVGSGLMYVSPLRNNSSLLEGKSHVRKQMVDLTTVDHFIKGKPLPDLIRMDVEGYEIEIISGMQNLMKSKHPFKIVMELHLNILGCRAAGMLRMLEQHGFKADLVCMEPPPSVQDSAWGSRVIKTLDRGVGLETGYHDITIEQLATEKRFTSGQVEDLEVVFTR